MTGRATCTTVHSSPACRAHSLRSIEIEEDEQDHDSSRHLDEVVGLLLVEGHRLAEHRVEIDTAKSRE